MQVLGQYRVVKKIKVYVAGKLEDAQSVRNIIAALVKTGYVEITHDWTQYFKQDGSLPDRIEAVRMAWWDMEGVRQCDILVVEAAQARDFRGTYVELGAAIAMGKIVYVLGHGMDRCAFTHHLGVQIVENPTQMIQAIANMGLR